MKKNNVYDPYMTDEAFAEFLAEIAVTLDEACVEEFKKLREHDLAVLAANPNYVFCAPSDTSRSDEYEYTDNFSEELFTYLDT